MGATASMLAMIIPISAMKNVTTRALRGSPLFVSFLKMERKGIMSSRAMACNNLGAPAQENKKNHFTIKLPSSSTSFREVKEQNFLWEIKTVERVNHSLTKH